MGPNPDFARPSQTRNDANAPRDTTQTGFVDWDYGNIGAALSPADCDP
jgi:hypothetical protein